MMKHTCPFIVKPIARSGDWGFRNEVWRVGDFYRWPVDTGPWV